MSSFSTNDRERIFITIAKAVTEFMKSHPNGIIWVRGSTASRVRLYQMAISAFWPLINRQYEIQGRRGKRWLPFERGVNYEEFLLFRKML